MDIQLADRAKTSQPAVFLDRDGTINVEKNYLYRFEDWEWISGAKEAITKLNKAGFLVVVVSNQAGVARGLYTARDVENLHARVSVDLELMGGKIDAYYFCPHHPNYGNQRACECRKPRPGMLINASFDLNIDLAQSWLVGDKLIDLLAAQAVGVRGVLVQTGYGKYELPLLSRGDLTAADLPTAASMIVKGTNNNDRISQ